MARPNEFKDRVGISGAAERADKIAFEGICRREGKTVAEKIAELVQDYVRIHGSGNPQYSLEQFTENPEFRAVPALLERPEKWLKALDHTDLDDLEQIERQAEMVRNMARGQQDVKLREASRHLKSQRLADVVEKRRPALPEQVDPDGARRSELRRLFTALARPDHDRRGSFYSANYQRRQRVIQHILALQVLLTEYQRTQEYFEWEEAQRLQTR